MTLEDEHPRSEGVQYATRKEWKQLLIDPERMKQLGQTGNKTYLQLSLMVKIESDAVKNNISQELGMLSS